MKYIYLQFDRKLYRNKYEVYLQVDRKSIQKFYSILGVKFENWPILNHLISSILHKYRAIAAENLKITMDWSMSHPNNENTKAIIILLLSIIRSKIH